MQENLGIKRQLPIYKYLAVITCETLKKAGVQF